MLLRWRGGGILLAIFLIIGRAVAQSTCPTLVQEALEHVVTSCEEVNRNQACYGNVWIHATPYADTPEFHFNRIGDIVDVLQLAALRLDPLDEMRGVWGIAIMQLQADIPDTLPGQNVTFLLFGDVEIKNKAAEDQSPMQAFYLRSGMGDAACREAPESGVLIQTPQGVESVNFNINGVDVEVGSTIMLQAQPTGDFIIRTLEGAAVLTTNGTSYPVIAGTQITLPLNDEMQPEGMPSQVMPLSNIILETLPLRLLPRQIPPPTPLPEDRLIKLQRRLNAGLDPCGEVGLPDCNNALAPDPERDWVVTTVPMERGVSDSVVPTLPVQVNVPPVPTVQVSLPELGGQPDTPPDNPPAQENVAPETAVEVNPPVQETQAAASPHNPTVELNLPPVLSVEVDLQPEGPESPAVEVDLPLLPPLQIDCLLFCRR